MHFHAAQCEMMAQMQMMSVLQMQQGPLEMQRLIMESRMNPMLPFIQQMMWMPMMIQMQNNMNNEASSNTVVEMNEDTNCSSSPNKTVDTPMDLSRKSGLEAILQLESLAQQETQTSTEKSATPEINIVVDEVQKSGYNIKRNYSQVDLNAAVNDIRCGKLGTRRASVVYGIPRSTLRNKIYKLEAAEELAGVAVPFKRRRPGGQTAADRKKAERAIAESKKPTSPVSEGCSSGPSSVDSTIMEAGPPILQKEEGDDEDDTTKATASRSSDTGGPTAEWAANLWQNLFKQQNLGESKSSSKNVKKKEENGEWKRSRPKRGQYRKYDKTALDEAVQSVRRGDMSVHRAGSFYGVPHSTLEYKVKERYLMRKKRSSPSSEHSQSPSVEPPAVSIPQLMNPIATV